MKTNHGTVLDRGRVKKLLAVAATAIVASVALAVPSWAAVNGPGRNLEVDYSRDFVLLEGYPLNTNIKVDVIRNGVDIGTFTGQAEEITRPGRAPVSTLEINHAGAPPGSTVNDCWQGAFSPDIKPGDKVQATVLGTAGDVDYTFTRSLNFSEDPATGVISGKATGVERADGTFDLAAPITANTDPEVDGVIIEAKRVQEDRQVFREFVSPDAGGNFELDLPGSGGEVTLQYINPQAAADAVESTVAGPAAEEATEAVDGCPPLARTAMTSLSRSVVNLANVNTNLTIGGVAQDGITGVNVALGGKTYPATPANGTWTLTVPAADLGALPQGRSNVVASFVGNVAPPDQTRTILKDTVAPRAPRATPRAGTYPRPQSVTLSAEASAKIRYTVDGRTPTATSRLFVNPIRVTGTQTIKAVAYDAAGNRGEVAAFRYVIR